MHTAFHPIVAVAALLASPVSLAATAGEYPAKPIRIIAQFTAGSSTDILARIVAAKLSQDWNLSLIHI